MHFWAKLSSNERNPRSFTFEYSPTLIAYYALTTKAKYKYLPKDIASIFYITKPLPMENIDIPFLVGRLHCQRKYPYIYTPILIYPLDWIIGSVDSANFSRNSSKRHRMV